MPGAVPIDVSLYKTVLNEAKQTFKVWPSAYASGWVVHEYKKRGGRYKSIEHSEVRNHSCSRKRRKSSRKSSRRRERAPLKRWFDEVWIDVCQLPRIVPCGRQNLSYETYETYEKNYPYCRPLKRIT